MNWTLPQLESKTLNLLRTTILLFCVYSDKFSTEAVAKQLHSEDQGVGSLINTAVKLCWKLKHPDDVEINIMNAAANWCGFNSMFPDAEKHILADDGWQQLCNELKQLLDNRSLI